MGFLDEIQVLIIQQSGGSERHLIHFISYTIISFGIFVALALQFIHSPYGRYGTSDWGFPVNAKLAWILQELPCLILPAYLILFTNCPQIQFLPNKILIGLFFIHYIHRSLIYPLLIKGGKPTPFLTFVSAISFCIINSYIQIAYLLRWTEFGPDEVYSFHFGLGVIIFIIGMGINIHSDSILRNLRKEGENGYKIPDGGLFEYVSGANFFGEMLEWWGFALANWSVPAVAYAIFTSCNIGPRACQHHRWYKQKFEGYPKSRMALIPFIL